MNHDFEFEVTINGVLLWVQYNMANDEELDVMKVYIGGVDATPVLDGVVLTELENKCYDDFRESLPEPEYEPEDDNG